jgi:hypothetical protein
MFHTGNNKAARLTGEQVVEIRERYGTEIGLSQSMLARQYDVSINTVAKIVNGLSWRHLLRAGDEPKVDRPPFAARLPPIQPGEAEASAGRLLERLAAQEQQAAAETEAQTQAVVESPGMDRLRREAGSLAAIGAELDRLKGD